MAVSFLNIPSNIRVPLFYADVDPSQAFVSQLPYRVLILGQMFTTGGDAGTATKDIPVLTTQTDQAKTMFGVGSMLARMYEAYRLNDQFTEVWCLPLEDAAAGAAAEGSLAISGPATGNGTINLYIAGQRVQIGVQVGDTATEIGDAIETAVNAMASLPVTADNSAGTVTLTAKWKGETGNYIDLRCNYRGTQGGEEFPGGVGVIATAMADGATNPALDAALANMGDEQFDYIVLPYTDSTSLDAIATLLNDVTGRWSYAKQLYGHAFAARVAGVATLQTLGVSRNDQHTDIIAISNTPTPPWQMAAEFGAQCARSLSIDPARPLQTLPLLGVLPPPPQSRFNLTEAQTLLTNGIATTYVEGGYVRIQRAITTYRVNAFGQPDASYLDVETMATLAYILRTLKGRITQKFPRHKLANDGTRFGAGQAIVTPSAIKSELIAAYAEMERDGIVENREAFIANLIVERDANDPNRVNVLFPPDLVNQLRIFAVLAQFRLQYPTAA